MPESLVDKKKIKIDKVIQHLLKVTTTKGYKKFNNFVNFDLFFTKLLGIDPNEKRIN